MVLPLPWHFTPGIKGEGKGQYLELEDPYPAKDPSTQEGEFVELCVNVEALFNFKYYNLIPKFYHIRQNSTLFVNV